MAFLRSAPDVRPSTRRTGWRDGFCVVLLVVVAFIGSLEGSSKLTPVFTAIEGQNKWFGADPYRVFANMSSRWSNHHRASVHPLFGLGVFPLVRGLRLLGGMDDVSAVRLVIAACAALWLCAVFGLLRLLGRWPLEAMLFSLLAASSAAAVCWWTIPETYGFGSLTILSALILVVIAQRRHLAERWYIAVSALTLSITITNWMMGVFAAFVKLPRHRALQVTVKAFAVVMLLWGVEKILFPSTKFLMGVVEERRYVETANAEGALGIVTAFVLRSVIMPSAGSGGTANPWGVTGVVLWGAILFLGIVGCLADPHQPALRRVLLLGLFAQLALHLVYGGSETFLYSLHWLPMLIVLASFSVATRWRAAALVLTVTLTLCAGINNVVTFQQASALAIRAMAFP